MAVLGSTIAIVIGFVISYYLWSYNGLPIGWDTPHYIDQSRIVATQGPLAFFAVQGPYDCVYQLLSGFLVWLGISAITLEIFLPIILSALFPLVMSRLALSNSNIRLATLIAIATPGWYAIYALGAELHSNLLGMLLVLAALPILTKAESVKKPATMVGLSLVAIASFTHIETTLFLVTTIVVSSIVISTVARRIAISTVLVVLPATAIYILHVLQLFGLVGGALPQFSLEQVWFWIVIFGPLLPLAGYGLAVILIGPRTRLEVFAAVWAILSLAIGLSQYLDPQDYIFAQRAALLVPVPLLAAIGFFRLPPLVGERRIELGLPHNFWRGLIITGLVLLVVSWPVTYWVSANDNQKVYLPSSAAQRLQWISTHIRFSTAPIFIYNDYDSVAGSYGDLYNNWVGAIIGPHFSYVGRLDYLGQVQETPFQTTTSRLVAAVFMKQMTDSGITNRAALLQHPIILVTDLYRPYPLPNYFSSYFYQIGDGVFQANATMLQTINSITLPLSSASANLVGPWYSVQQQWAQSINTLEAHVISAPVPLQASFPLGVSQNGSYTMNLRYWDGTGNNVELELDQVTIGTVHYLNTNSPTILNIPGLNLKAGLHTLVIKIDSSPPGPEFASLDYVALTSA